MSGDANQFDDELRRVIERHRAENDLTYAEAVGVLYLILSDLAEEAKEPTDGAKPKKAHNQQRKEQQHGQNRKTRPITHY